MINFPLRSVREEKGRRAICWSSGRICLLLVILEEKTQNIRFDHVWVWSIDIWTDHFCILSTVSHLDFISKASSSSSSFFRFCSLSSSCIGLLRRTERAREREREKEKERRECCVSYLNKYWAKRTHSHVRSDHDDINNRWQSKIVHMEYSSFGTVVFVHSEFHSSSSNSIPFRCLH